MTFMEQYKERCKVDSDIKEHLPALLTAACKKNVYVIDLGVRGGMSTCAFLAGVEEGGGHVWSSDICWPAVPDQWFASPLWSFVPGNDVESVNKFPDEVDVLFIDTSHTYEHTLKELELFVPKVKDRGVVILHDTDLKYVEGEAIFFPVRSAVEQYCDKHNFDFQNIEGCNGLGYFFVTRPLEAVA